MVFLYTIIMRKFQKNDSANIILALVGVALLGVVSYGVYLLVQKNRPQKSSNDSNITLVDLDRSTETALDSDGDGLFDWEENLWPELNPHNADSDSDGVSDYDYIRQKKRDLESELGIDNEFIESISEMDRLGQGLYLTLSELAADGEMQDGDKAVLVEDLVAHVENLNLGKRIYTKNDFSIVGNTIPARLNYKSEIADLTERYPMPISDFDLILSTASDFELVQSQDEISRLKTKYEKYASTLLTIMVPLDIAPQHIELTNIATQMSGIFENLSRDPENVDDLVSLSALVQSEELFERAQKVFSDLGTYFDIIEAAQ